MSDAPTDLAAWLPEAAAGYAQIRARLARDGALPAATKALLVATAAATRGVETLAGSELCRARGLGVGEELVAVCAGALLLSRGEAACARLPIAGGPPHGTPARPESELDGPAYFLAYNESHELPPRMRLLYELEPDVFDGYFHMHHAVLRSDPRTDRFAELALCTIQAAELESGFLALHAAGARRLGVSDVELVEAVLCAVPVAGVAAWAAGAAALFPDG
jgi:alkylhydroperoxidase/carboxymuconolactone decarboxylase family protein YurZ